ncbi:RICIN domain-containing protein [Streptomyces sp. NPDC058290]|uniref:RICIN domain-containing protein n=1 Tax=Streptomyces sp. NPDC058290 TaxID=3346426 RepID=UPI0036ED695F
MKARIRTVAIAGAVVALAGVLSATAQAAPSSTNGPSFTMWNGNGDGAGGHPKCLSIEGSGTSANNARAIIWDCNGGLEQFWSWTGTHQLKNAKTGKCLSVAASSTSAGAELIQYTCADYYAPEQAWFVEEEGNYDHFRNGNSRKYLSLDNGGSVANGTRAIQWWWNTGGEQTWYWL